MAASQRASERVGERYERTSGGHRWRIAQKAATTGHKHAKRSLARARAHIFFPRRHQAAPAAARRQRCLKLEKR